jgi:hypothetical protein
MPHAGYFMASRRQHLINETTSSLLQSHHQPSEFRNLLPNCEELNAAYTNKVWNCSYPRTPFLGSPEVQHLKRNLPSNHCKLTSALDVSEGTDERPPRAMTVSRQEWH